MVGREALVGNAGIGVVEHHPLALAHAERGDVALLQRAGHHNQAVAAALHQELDAVDGLAAGVAQVDAERHNHVQAGGAQFGVDQLQDRV